MKDLYSIDVRVYATAYIRADSAEEATAIARGLKDSTLEVSDDSGGDVEISGRQFDDPDLPDVSLSPAMTIVGPDDDDVASPAD